MDYFGHYLPQDSPLHRRDPRVKIIAVLIFSILILRMNMKGLAVSACILTALALLSRIPIRSLLKSLYPVVPFFSVLFILYVLLTPGNPVPILPNGPIQITYEGLNIGTNQVTRFSLLILNASLFTMTTNPTEIAAGLERLLRPVRIIGISSNNIAMMISLALRFFPELAGELNTLRQAQIARGGGFGSNRTARKIKAVGYLAFTVAVNILRRCDELVDAMEARGYSPGKRTYLRELCLCRGDYCFITCLAAIVYFMECLWV